MIKIFTPSFADTNNTNPQNLTVKQIVRRLDPDLFHVTMYYIKDKIDFIKDRPNTSFLKWRPYNNTFQFFLHHIISKYDIYFYPRYTHLEKIFMLYKNLGADTKIVTHIVHTIPDDYIKNKFFVKLLNQSYCVAGNSEYVSKTIKDVFNLEPHVIHNGIDTECFYPNENINVKSTDVFYAGSFQQRKRPEVIVNIAKEFSNLKFALAGSGELLNILKAKCKSQGINNVKFFGHVSQKKLGELMRNSKIFLFPSKNSEGHPQVLGQSSACGTPIIAMESIKPDYVVHKKNGFLINNDNEISPLIKKIINNNDLRKDMSDYGIKHMKKFNWENIVIKWENIFIEAIS